MVGTAIFGTTTWPPLRSTTATVSSASATPIVFTTGFHERASRCQEVLCGTPERVSVGAARRDFSCSAERRAAVQGARRRGVANPGRRAPFGYVRQQTGGSDGNSISVGGSQSWRSLLVSTQASIRSRKWPLYQAAARRGSAGNWCCLLIGGMRNLCRPDVRSHQNTSFQRLLSLTDSWLELGAGYAL